MAPRNRRSLRCAVMLAGWVAACGGAAQGDSDESDAANTDGVTAPGAAEGDMSRSEAADTVGDVAPSGGEATTPDAAESGFETDIGPLSDWSCLEPGSAPIQSQTNLDGVLLRVPVVELSSGVSVPDLQVSLCRDGDPDCSEPLRPNAPEPALHVVEGASSSAEGVTATLPIEQSAILRFQAPGLLPTDYHVSGSTRSLLGEREVPPSINEFALVDLAPIRMLSPDHLEPESSRMSNGPLGLVQVRVFDCAGAEALATNARVWREQVGTDMLQWEADTGFSPVELETAMGTAGQVTYAGGERSFGVEVLYRGGTVGFAHVELRPAALRVYEVYPGDWL